jgi:hypothetical protein
VWRRREVAGRGSSLGRSGIVSRDVSQGAPVSWDGLLVRPSHGEGGSPADSASRPPAEARRMLLAGRRRRDERSATGGVLAVAPQFNLLTGLFTVVAAVFPIRTVRLNDALARRVGTLRSFGHLDLPPRFANSTPRQPFSSSSTWPGALTFRHASSATAVDASGWTHDHCFSSCTNCVFAAPNAKDLNPDDVLMWQGGACQTCIERPTEKRRHLREDGALRLQH